MRIRSDRRAREGSAGTYGIGGIGGRRPLVARGQEDRGHEGHVAEEHGRHR